MKIQNETVKKLWQIRNPHRSNPSKKELQELKEKLQKQASNETSPNETLPPKQAFIELTTARNRHLINPNEQTKLRKTVVGFFGLSVGSHAALTWMMQTRADHVKISDPDTIDATNLNRLRFGWQHVGAKKIDVVEAQLYQLNPYTTVTKTARTNHKTIQSFFNTHPKLDVVVDAVDDIQAKLWLRQLSRQHQLPLVSAADVGDNVLLDIERYDLQQEYPYFHNKVNNIESIDFDNLSETARKKLIIKLVGFKHNSEKLLETLFQIGGSVKTWPQLGATATIAGGVVTTTIKKIILKETVESGRYYISLDEILDQSFNSLSRQQIRKKYINTIKKELDNEA